MNTLLLIIYLLALTHTHTHTHIYSCVVGQHHYNDTILNINYPTTTLPQLCSLPSSPQAQMLTQHGFNDSTNVQSTFKREQTAPQNLIHEQQRQRRIMNMRPSKNTNTSMQQLLQFINIVEQDMDMDCSRQISYLMQGVGMVKSQLFYKQLFLQQLNILTNFAIQQTNTLNQHVQELSQERQKDKLYTSQIIHHYQHNIRQLNTISQSIRKIQHKIQHKQQHISSLTAQVINIEQQTIAIREIRQEQIGELTKTNQHILHIQNRIRQHKLNINTYQHNIQQSTNIIRDNHQLTTNMKIKIKHIRAYVDDYNDRAQYFMTKASHLQIQIQRTSSDLLQAQHKQHTYTSQIHTLQTQINHINHNIGFTQYYDADECVSVLKQMANKLDKQIQILYDENYVQYNQQYMQLTMSRYLRKMYGSNIGVPNSIAQLSYEQLNMHKVNIYEQKWKDKYGYQLQYFNCLYKYRHVQTGYGMITYVNGNQIYVDNRQGDRQLVFVMGACTRLQSTQQLPNIGSYMFYSAVQVQYGVYHLYLGTIV